MQTPASAAPAPPLRGPEAIAYALSKINLDDVEAHSRQQIASGKITRRKPAVRLLNIVKGLRRNDVQPSELMLTKVPVIPAAFRPYSAMGDTFIPGDANELYADLNLIRNAYKEAETNFGPQNAGEHYMQLAGAVAAVMGHGEAVRPKTKERGVSGLMKIITGRSPKHSMLQSKMIAKTVDSVSRGVITVDPELGLDEIGMPLPMAWESYKDYIQRRLVRSGLSPVDAVRHLRDRTPLARRMLDLEVKERPVIYSRAPAWHKFNSIAAYPKLVEGNNIAINSYVGTGLGADHDGDTINIHVPSLPDSVKEAKEKLMASKMLFSVKDQDKIVPAPKQDLLLGINTANRRRSGIVHRFPTQADAMKAIGTGQVSLEDDVEFD